VSLPVAGEIHRFVALHCERGNLAHLLAIRGAAVTCIAALELDGVALEEI